MSEEVDVALTPPVPRSAGRRSQQPDLERIPLLSDTAWRRVRLGMAIVYLVVVAWIIVFYGVPTGRQAIALIIVAGLLVTRIGQGWGRLGLVFVDWLPFTLVLILYDRSRGLAASIGLHVHESDAVHWEKWFCGGVVPTVWLQHHLFNPAHIYWYDALMTLVYTSHFIATPLLAAVLWLRDRAQWLRFVTRVIVLSIAGLITYTFLPEAPPWMASKDGYLPAGVGRLSARGWEWLHLGNLKTLLAQAQETGSNPVAAMPSLHTAFATLIAIFIASRMRSRWRYLLALYPIAMGFSLVYLGEHYVIDVVVGMAYAVAAHQALLRWERYRAGRKRENSRVAGKMSDLGLVSTDVTGVEAGVSGTEMAR